MTYDQELFKDLDATYNTNVRIGNGEKIAVKGKGTIMIETVFRYLKVRYMS